jgi:NADH dehydrogenase FAD-containing subunit
MLRRGNDRSLSIREAVVGKRVVIVGAGAGGASVAAEARRGDSSLSITMIEQRGQVSVAA